MREKVIRPSDKIAISQSREEAQIFDLSAIENIDPTKVQELYQKAITDNTETVLKLVTLRVAMDSIFNNVERAMTTAMNGSPVEIINEKSSERIDDVFDKALLVFCLEQAMSAVTSNEELKRDFVQKYMETPRVLAPSQAKPDENAVAGIVTSRSQQALVESKVDAIRERVEKQLRHTDDSTSPYGNNSTEKPNSKVSRRGDKGLPVAGTVKRKTMRGRSR